LSLPLNTARRAGQPVSELLHLSVVLGMPSVYPGLCALKSPLKLALAYPLSRLSRMRDFGRQCCQLGLQLS
jgi:hypothetical protein